MLSSCCNLVLFHQKSHCKTKIIDFNQIPQSMLLCSVDACTFGCKQKNEPKQRAYHHVQAHCIKKIALLHYIRQDRPKINTSD